MNVADQRRLRVHAGKVLVRSGVLALLIPVAGAWAQSVDCDQLRGELSVASRGDPVRAAQFARALQRQRSELERTQDYASQIDCDGGGFNVFGSETAPQCDGIHAQIERMTGNLGVLQNQLSALQRGDPDRQASLGARYQALCGQGGPGTTAGYDAEPASPGDEVMRPGVDDTNQVQPSDGAPPRSGGKAICVRTCDGGFFPLSYAGEARDLGSLQSLCTALCPNTEAKLYTTPDTDNIGAAVSVDGTPYTDLPTAFKFQKAFVSTCSCKPPNKSWVEALAEAEKLLGNTSPADITVTAKMSDEMARPSAAVPVTPPKVKAAKARRKAKVGHEVDAQIGPGLSGAQIPASATDQGAIAGNSGVDRLPLRTGTDPSQALPGFDFATRRARTIAPAP